jgi:hypothetical protein
MGSSALLGEIGDYRTSLNSASALPNLFFLVANSVAVPHSRRMKIITK